MTKNLKLKIQTNKNLVITPKGTVFSGSILVSNLIFRQSISSTCQVAITSTTIVLNGQLLADLIVAVGSIDLVVGELDR